MLSSKEAIQITNMSMERIYQETLVDIEEQIKDCVSNGYNEFVYSVSKKSHVSDIIEHLKSHGYKVKETGKFFHAGYNQISIKW